MSCRSCEAANGLAGGIMVGMADGMDSGEGLSGPLKWSGREGGEGAGFGL